MPLSTMITSTPVPTATPPTTLPANVYWDAGTSAHHMTFSQSIWMPNNDNTIYNAGVYRFTGAGGPYIGGRKQLGAGGNAVEMCGFVNIPNGWRATKTFVDIHSSHVDTLYEPFDANYAIYEVTTWTAADPIVPATDGPKTIGGVVTTATTGTLYELDETMVGAIDNAMWILLATGATWHMVAGGYIVIEEI